MVYLINLTKSQNLLHGLWLWQHFQKSFVIKRASWRKKVICFEFLSPSKHASPLAWYPRLALPTPWRPLVWKLKDVKQKKISALAFNTLYIFRPSSEKQQQSRTSNHLRFHLLTYVMLQLGCGAVKDGKHILPFAYSYWFIFCRRFPLCCRLVCLRSLTQNENVFSACFKVKE